MNLDSDETAVVSVKVETEPTLKAGSPETLFRGPYPITSWLWDIHPNGKLFLIMKRA
jgi:hypothetical protein